MEEEKGVFVECYLYMLPVHVPLSLRASESRMFVVFFVANHLLLYLDRGQERGTYRYWGTIPCASTSQYPHVMVVPAPVPAQLVCREWGGELKMEILEEGVRKESRKETSQYRTINSMFLGAT